MKFVALRNFRSVMVGTDLFLNFSSNIFSVVCMLQNLYPFYVPGIVHTFLSTKATAWSACSILPW
jgi:hypothetical protein